MSSVVETTFRVRYAETDQSGIVYNANYLVWFEVGRGEFFWQRGLDYGRDIEAHGTVWPVTEAALRFLAPAYYGDLVTVRTWVDELKSRGITFHYEIRRGDEILCTGFTKHVNVDKNGRVVPISEGQRKFLKEKLDV